MSKPKRQGLLVTAPQLRKLASELETEIRTNEEKYQESLYGTKFQINIVNYTGNSDDWEIENG